MTLADRVACDAESPAIVPFRLVTWLLSIWVSALSLAFSANGTASNRVRVDSSVPLTVRARKSWPLSTETMPFPLAPNWKL